MHVYSMTLNSPSTGFSIRVDRGSRSSKMGPLYVREVEEGEPAGRQGVQQGDEVMLINDTSVTELDWETVESVLKGSRGTFQTAPVVLCIIKIKHWANFQLLCHCFWHLEPTVTLTLRSCRVEMPLPQINSNRIVESLICPVPPRNPVVSSDMHATKPDCAHAKW